MTVFETVKITQRRAAVIAGIATFVMAGFPNKLKSNQRVLLVYNS